jgi:pSer/pThr/pTyr-binding forkhead associated (FHA) protein
MVDPSLDVDPAPETPCPKDQPAAFFTLDHPEIQIGRRDPRRDVQPEIALYDPGISHRHAVLRQTSDGGIDLYDQRSTNGTDVNGVPVVPDTPHRLHEGDAITLGRWTRIAIRRQQ